MRLPPSINDVETGRTPQYPDVQPLHVTAAPERAFAVVAETAGRQKRWTVVKVDTQERVLFAEARTSVWGFTYEVTLRVEAEAGGAVLHMRSRSRMGSRDLGANARRIRRFLREVDDALKSSVVRAGRAG